MQQFPIFGSLTLAILLSITPSIADGALEPPHEYTIYSPDSSKCLQSDPATGITTVFKVDKKKNEKKKYWSMVGWYRLTYLTNDGSHVVIGYDGWNLVPKDYRLNEPMLYFVKKGEVISHVTLEEILKVPANMEETSDNFAWGNYIGIDKKGNMEVETFERTLFYNPKTGKIVKVEK